MKTNNKEVAWGLFRQKIKQLNISDTMDESDYFICLYADFDASEGVSYYFGDNGKMKIINVPREVNKFNSETFEATFESIELAPKQLEMKTLGAVFYYYSCYLRDIGFIKVD